MSYDNQSLELAKSFLSDANKSWGEKEFEVVADELAKEIQATIEDFMQSRGIES